MAYKPKCKHHQYPSTELETACFHTDPADMAIVLAKAADLRKDELNLAPCPEENRRDLLSISENNSEWFIMEKLKDLENATFDGHDTQILYNHIQQIAKMVKKRTEGDPNRPPYFNDLGHFFDKTFTKIIKLYQTNYLAAFDFYNQRYGKNIATELVSEIY